MFVINQSGLSFTDSQRKDSGNRVNRSDLYKETALNVGNSSSCLYILDDLLALTLLLFARQGYCLIFHM